MTEHDYQRARRLLMRGDPVMRALIKRIGPCGLAGSLHADPFESLVQAIVWQQLSTKAAATIFGRFLALFRGATFPSPADVAAVPDDALRQVGFSRMKVSYIRDLCRRVTDGSLHLGQLESLNDEAVVRELTQVKGIGRWSAEMFLMFRLHRPDVLPVDDLGIVKAIQRAYGLRNPPTAERIRRLGEPWRPYRSVASWYLWASADNVPAKR